MVYCNSLNYLSAYKDLNIRQQRAHFLQVGIASNRRPKDELSLQKEAAIKVIANMPQVGEDS